MRIPIANLKPSIEETRPSWQANFDALLARGHYILGPEVERFESRWAGYLGAKHSVGVSTGSTAIELCLRDLKVTGQVLTSALTAPFTGVSIAASGATPVFADIDPETLQIDPDDLGNRITKKTAALLPVHLYGQPCRIAAIRKLSRLPIVQDACQAHGAARFHDYGDYIAYSFYPTKNLGCLGDGGAIVTNKPTIAKRLRQLRDGGRKPGTQLSVGPGINARLDELQACFLNAFLDRLPAWTESRRRLASLYDQALRHVTPVKTHPCSVRHLYVVRAPRRDKLRAYLAQKGIGTGIHYPVPLHLHPAFAASKQKKGSLPHAEKACREILSLPLWPQLGESSVLEVAEAIQGFYRS